ncbi:MAG TPA: hypothetical protein VGA28_04055 [Desulfurivibrionaceae bacterium]
MLNGIGCNGVSVYPVLITTTMPTTDHKTQPAEIKDFLVKEQDSSNAESKQEMQVGYFLSMPQSAYWLFFTQPEIIRKQKDARMP